MSQRDPSARWRQRVGRIIWGAAALCGSWTPLVAGQLQPYSAQLHVHASYSEGGGSIESETYEFNQAGIDVVWWSDHDSIAGLIHSVSTFGFEGFEEPLDLNEPWSPMCWYEAVLTKRCEPYKNESFTAAAAQFVTSPVHRGAKSLRLTGARLGSDFGQYSYRFWAPSSRHTYPIAAQVTVDLAIFPETVGPSATAIVQVDLSCHAANEVLPAACYVLIYYLDNQATESHREGAVYYVPLPYRQGRWNEFSLPITDDVVRGFPFIDPLDNSMGVLSFGVRSREDVPAAVCFDSLHIRHELEGQQLYDTQRDRMARVAQRFPDVAQHQGVEISFLTDHLNEFSLDTPLPDYEAMFAASGLADAAGYVTNWTALRAFAARYWVEQAHARGGLVSFDHMFFPDVEPPLYTREQIRSNLLYCRVWGADLLEVGYVYRGGHSLEDHLWVWDELAKEELYLVGTAVSDYHGGAVGCWQSYQNSFLTWIWASSKAKADLIEGLRSGRVFFGHQAVYDGRLDLSTPQGFVMGQIVLTDQPGQQVIAQVDGLALGDQLRWVISGQPLPTVVAQQSQVQIEQMVLLTPSNGAFARLEVYTAGGTPKVFSNPIYFVRRVPPEGIPPAQSFGLCPPVLANLTAGEVWQPDRRYRSNYKGPSGCSG